jgi:hypothetical protein
MGARHYTIYRDRIEYTGWLVVDARGGMRLTRGPTKCEPGERKVQLTVTVPQTVFNTPEMSVKVNFGGPACQHLQAEVEARLSDLIATDRVQLVIGPNQP